MPPSSPPPLGFDRVADRYRADEQNNLAFSRMRELSDLHLRDAFPPGARLIDVGSGAGTEAARMATRGHRIALVDVSPRLLEVAEQNVRSAAPGGLLGAHLMPARRVGDLAAVYGPAFFDGAYSSLGPLNGEPDLRPVAAGLARLIRPGGTLILSVMNRICAVETAWFAAHGQWRQAARRWGGPVKASVSPGGPKDVTTWYHSRRHIEAAFGRAFATEAAEALPLLWPPTYLDFLVVRFSRFYRALGPLDRRLSRWPLLRDLGDHILVKLRRRGNA